MDQCLEAKYFVIFRSNKYKELRNFCIPELHENYYKHCISAGNALQITEVLATDDSLLAQIRGADVDALVTAAQQCGLLSYLIKVVGQGSSLGQALCSSQTSKQLLHSWSHLKAVVLQSSHARAVAERHLLHQLNCHLEEQDPQHAPATPSRNSLRNNNTAGSTKSNCTTLIAVQLHEEEYIFGIQLAVGRQVGGQSSLKRAPTSMLPELAALTASFAGVSRGSIVLDPCCGSGTLLYASAQLGAAFLLGSDADERVLSLQSAPLDLPLPLPGHKRPEIELGFNTILGSVCSLRIKEMAFDAIVVDPPYGHRAAALVDQNPQLSVGDESIVQSSLKAKIEGAGFGPVIEAVWHLAGQVLVSGGRIACWLPIKDPTNGGLAGLAVEGVGQSQGEVRQLAAAAGLQLIHYLVETRSGGLLRALAVGQKPGTKLNMKSRSDVALQMTKVQRAGATLTDRGCDATTVQGTGKEENEDVLTKRRQTAYKHERSSTSGTDIDIWRAAWLGDVGAVEAYLAAGGDVNARDKKGQTALQFASGYNKLAVVEVLLQAGADTKLAKDKHGMCALTRAAARGHTSIVVKLLERRVNAADPAQRCKKTGQTALMYASQFGHLDAVQALLNHFQANTTAQNISLVEYVLMCDDEGFNAAHLAAQWGMSSVLDLLLTCTTAGTGNKPRTPIVNHPTQCESRWTLVHVACRWGHVGVLKVLRKHGGDLEGRCGRDGRRPIDEAREWKRQNCVDYLEEQIR